MSTFTAAIDAKINELGRSAIGMTRQGKEAINHEIFGLTIARDLFLESCLDLDLANAQAYIKHLEGVILKYQAAQFQTTAKA